MIQGLDSASPPSDAALAAAKAAGRDLWAGYFKFTSIDNIYNGWADSDFQRVVAAGLETLAFCSGLDDPIACKNRGTTLGISILLDDESGMRPDGSWVEPWLAASGAGLYGNGSFHFNSQGLRTASCHIFAGYYGYDPQTTWPSWLPAPSVPCGWQWRGSHPEFGLTVDSGWYDEGIADMGLTSEERGWLREIYAELRGDRQFSNIDLIMGNHSDPTYAASLPAVLKAVQSVAPAGADNTAVLAAIADLKAHPSVISDPVLLQKITAIEANLNAPKPPA